MNYAELIRHKLYTGTDEPIRAAIYARVSTDNEGQKESCANQVELAQNFINRHPNIVVVGTFVDDGISAKNDFTRPEYNKMLENITDGKVDLIICKALSRLNRNDTTSSILKELCISTNTTILTLEDNAIQDFDDPNSEMMYGFKSIMDAQYVRKQSINGKKTHELRCERKELSAKDISYGYTWDKNTKTISVNAEEADIIRRIFDEYVFHNGTPSTIHRALKKDGVNITEKRVNTIIQDERYIGNFYINKRTSKLGTGQTKSKRIKLPKEQWILIERPDLQIIDTDIFNMAQRVHETRITMYEKPDKQTTQAHFQGSHIFAGKIFCPVCGKPFHFGYADRKQTKPIYRISKHSDCSSPVSRISETELEDITREALKNVLEEQTNVCESLKLILAECVRASQNCDNDIEKLKRQRTSLESKIDNLVSTLSEGGLTEAGKERIKSSINSISEDLDKLTEVIQDKENNKLDDSYVSDKIKEISNAIEELKNFTTIDRERILNYVERIELQPNKDITIVLKTGHVLKVTQQLNSDFSDDGNSVGKMGVQDGRY